MIRSEGNRVYHIPNTLLFSFPVKHNWWEKADPSLIIKSALELLAAVDVRKVDMRVYMPRPGCGNGGLLWADVKPLIEDILDDRFTIVEVNRL